MAFAAISLLATVGKGAMDYYENKETQKAAANAASQQATMLEEAEMNQLKALEEQIAQVEDKTELEKLQRQRQALREKAKIRVASSEAGVMGNSVFRQIAAAMINSSMDMGVVDVNAANQKAQIGRQMEATMINTKRQKANIYSSVPDKPNPFFAGLNIAGSGLSAAAAGYGAGKGMFGAGEVTTGGGYYGNDPLNFPT
jgi:hypothetical protein